MLLKVSGKTPQIRSFCCCFQKQKLSLLKGTKCFLPTKLTMPWGVSIIKLREQSAQNGDCARGTHNQYNQIIILSRRKCVLTKPSIQEKAVGLQGACSEPPQVRKAIWNWGAQRAENQGQHSQGGAKTQLCPTWKERHRVLQVQREEESITGMCRSQPLSIQDGSPYSPGPWTVEPSTHVSVATGIQSLI